MQRRIPGPGLLIHSDRGVQYGCDGFRQVIDRQKMVQIMSRKGSRWSCSNIARNCWDNAVAESFLRTLKTEWAYHVDLTDLEHARSERFEYIEQIYNHHPLHPTLDYLSPAVFEMRKTR